MKEIFVVDGANVNNNDNPKRALRFVLFAC